MPSVSVLPFDVKLGYPQIQLVRINNVAYKLFYRYNYSGRFAVLKIRRMLDNRIVFEGKLTEKNPFEVRDPTTYETLFTILPWIVTDKLAEVWLFV